MVLTLYIAHGASAKLPSKGTCWPRAQGGVGVQGWHAESAQALRGTVVSTYEHSPSAPSTDIENLL